MSVQVSVSGIGVVSGTYNEVEARLLEIGFTKSTVDFLLSSYRADIGVEEVAGSGSTGSPDKGMVIEYLEGMGLGTETEQYSWLQSAWSALQEQAADDEREEQLITQIQSITGEIGILRDEIERLEAVGGEIGELNSQVDVLKESLSTFEGLYDQYHELSQSQTAIIEGLTGDINLSAEEIAELTTELGDIEKTMQETQETWEEAELMYEESIDIYKEKLAAKESGWNMGQLIGAGIGGLILIIGLVIVASFVVKR